MYFFYSKLSRIAVISQFYFSVSEALPTPCATLLPAPTGTFGIDVHSIELVDPTRSINPFAPDARPRAIEISLFYPVEASGGDTFTEMYMPPATAAYEDQKYEAMGFPNGSIFEQLALQVAHKRSSHNSKDFPIVLFSPAQGDTRLIYSVLAQSIATQGFIVVTMDHPFDTDIVEYPNGTLIYGIDIDNYTIPQQEAWVEEALPARVADVSFILDQLQNSTVISRLIPGNTGTLDVSKVAMFGHSLGGATAAQAMLQDTRIAGGLDMGGDFFGSVVTEGLDRPFMIMGAAGQNRTTDPLGTFSALWAVLRGWKLEVELANSLHYTFSDRPTFIQTLGINLSEADMENLLLVTTLNATRSREIIAAYVGAFLNFVLLGKNESLLQAPNVDFPEITFDQ
ncbi:MAG: hypothetical protein M1827_002710 [Pycnora praestabilis]|nr:MAG: hypothetical protein M1827_002710 [Pycnora praestabilis]